MRNDLSDITLIVDRSGSMEAIKSDAQGGINNFIEDQKKQPGQALFSLLQFDTEYEWVHKGIPIGNVQKYNLYPRGATALLDAVGRCINETGERLKNMAEDQRPGLIVIAIVTDGQENSSKEFTKKQIKDMITHQQDVYKWQFTYLGANQDAFDEAGSMGINLMGVMNYNSAKAGQTYSVLSSNVGRMRFSVMTDQPVNNCYSDEERNSVA